MRSRLMLHWWAGTIGGVLGWLLITISPWRPLDAAPGQPSPPVDYTQLVALGITVGLSVGACLGAAYAWGSGAKTRRAALVGGISGAVGGSIGLYIGQMIYGPLATQAAGWQDNNHGLAPIGFLLNIFARSLGWGIAGLGLGILQGTINGSPQRGKNGAIGGLVGGLLGGFAFELFAEVGQGLPILGFAMQGTVLRLISLTITGSSIGLFVGLAERVFRQAWVRVRAGRNEGAEFILDKPVNSIGRSEMSDVPLFGDMTVAPQHATISSMGGGYVLDALQPGVLVNGQPIQRARLEEGTVIRIGGREIEFHQKGAPRAVGPMVSQPMAAAPVMPEGVCAFCGQRKDAAGRCACAPASIPAAPLSAPVGVAAAVSGALTLVGLSGPCQGQRFPLGKPEITLGREPDRDIQLTGDSLVSRRHAHIAVTSEGVDVVDEGSSNGTFVNGQRVQRARARAGDELAIGSSRFRLEGA